MGEAMHVTSGGSGDHCMTCLGAVCYDFSWGASLPFTKCWQNFLKSGDLEYFFCYFLFFDSMGTLKNWWGVVLRHEALQYFYLLYLSYLY